MKYYISAAPAGPVSRLLTTLVAALSLVGFFFFGLVVVGIVLALLLVFGLVFWVRAWWLSRTTPGGSGPAPMAGQKGEVIDAEYTVVHRRRE